VCGGTVGASCGVVVGAWSYDVGVAVWSYDVGVPSKVPLGV
jgi:hypothetical protein